jgi:hypothetical protein
MITRIFCCRFIYLCQELNSSFHYSANVSRCQLLQILDVKNFLLKTSLDVNTFYLEFAFSFSNMLLVPMMIAIGGYLAVSNNDI